MVSTDDMLALLDEEKIPLSEVARLLQVHHTTIARWITAGKRGVKLEARRGEGKSWWTSREALARFLACVTNAEHRRCGGGVPVEQPQSKREAGELKRRSRAALRSIGIIIDDQQQEAEEQ